MTKRNIADFEEPIRHVDAIARSLKLMGASELLEETDGKTLEWLADQLATTARSMRVVWDDCMAAHQAEFDGKGRVA